MTDEDAETGRIRAGWPAADRPNGLDARATLPAPRRGPRGV